MIKTAVISFVASTGKWQATYQGKVLSASTSKSYVIDGIRTGRCTKANALGVSDVREDANMEISVDGHIEETAEKFSINERFDFLTDFTVAVAAREYCSLIVTGDGGLGKSHTVLEALASYGLKNASDLDTPIGTDSVLFPEESRKLFTVVKGYTTAKALFRTLYENRNRTIIFDDCDEVLKHPVATNLLKAALDSYEKRIVTWNAESFGDDDLPRSFEFKGSVIIISNMARTKIDRAVRTRSICVDVSMTTDQKIERMNWIVTNNGDKFMPDVSTDVKIAALEFLTRMKDSVNDLSMRSLIMVTKAARQGGQWERRAEYMLANMD